MISNNVKQYQILSDTHGYNNTATKITFIVRIKISILIAYDQL